MDTTIINKALAFLGKELKGVATNIIDSLSKPLDQIDNKLSRVIDKLNDISQKRPEIERSETREVKDPDYSFVIKSIEKTNEFQNKSNEFLIKELKEVVRGINIPESDLSPIIEAIASIKNEGVDITPILEKLQNIPSYEEKLGAILNAIKNIKIETKELSTVKLESSLKKISTDISSLKEMVPKLEIKESVEKILEAIKKLKLEFPKTFKIDEQQMKGLVSAVGYGGSGGGSMMASGVTVANTSLASANTEYSYTFPANTLSWKIKLRSQNTLLLYAFVTGKLPTSGDGTSYITAPQNYIESQAGVEWSGKTIYLQTAGTSQVAEILSFTM